MKSNQTVRQNSEFEDILENMPDPFVAIDFNWRVSYANQKLIALHRKRPEEVFGADFWEFLPLRNTPVEKVLKKVMDERVPVVFESCGRNSGRWHERYIFPTSGGIACFWRDISDQKKTQQGLQDARSELEERVRERTAELNDRTQQLQALVSELTLAEQRERRRLAEMLHDHLQQLLVAAKINGEVISAGIDAGLKEPAENVISLINQSIQTSRSLTAELSPPVLQQGNLSAALEWLARWMRENHGLAVELQLNPDLDPKREDITVLMFQSIRELLFNVVKHAGIRSARVEMVRHQDERLRVTVTDRGAGFNPAGIWDKAKAGTGFGLFSIRERLTLLGGSLEVESSPGNGAGFTLLVPAEAKTECAEKRIRKIIRKIHRAKTSGDRLRVLLADDHTVVRQGLSTMLNLHSDIEVVGEAADGAEAVQKARKLLPDVILMDISMPGMNGLEATRIIHSELSNIRIIGLSMHDAQDKAAAMVAAGASGYCPKDGDSNVLLSAIRGKVNTTDARPLTAAKRAG